MDCAKNRQLAMTKERCHESASTFAVSNGIYQLRGKKGRAAHTPASDLDRRRGDTRIVSKRNFSGVSGDPNHLQQYAK